MSLKYDSSNQSQRIFQDCILEKFTNDQARYPGNKQTGSNKSFIPRKFMIHEYLSKHDQLGYLMQNTDCLYVLLADSTTDWHLNQGELSWKEFLGEAALQRVHQQLAVMNEPLAYFPLGYALVVTKNDHPDKDDYSYRPDHLHYHWLHWVDIFYPDKNLMSLLMARLEEKRGFFPIPRDLSQSALVWQDDALMTKNLLCNLLYFTSNYLRMKDFIVHSTQWDQTWIDSLLLQIKDKVEKAEQAEKDWKEEQRRQREEQSRQREEHQSEGFCQIL
jgi:hypothetical protein